MINLLIKEWQNLESDFRAIERDKYELPSMIYSLAVILCGFIGLFLGISTIVGWLP